MDMLSKLPTELLEQIVKEMVETTPMDEFRVISQKDLSNLYLANRRCRDIVAPELYRSVHGGKQGSRLRSLLRTLVSRPDLASHVRTAELVWNYEDPFADADSRPDVRRDVGRKERNIFARASSSRKHNGDGKALGAAAAAVGITNPKLIEALETGDNQDAQVALLLHLLPNLNALHLFIPRIWSFVKDVLSPTLPPRPDFSSLPAGLRTVQRIRLTHSPLRAGFHTVDIVHTLFLPSVRTVVADLTYGRRLVPESWNMGDGYRDIVARVTDKSSVEELHFNEANLDADELGFLLQMTKNLTRLEYVHVQDGGENRFWPAEFGIALEQTRSSLRHLDVFVRQEDFGARGALRKLHLFPNLRSLIVPAMLLLGPEPAELPYSLADFLPPKLEWFGLYIGKDYCSIKTLTRHLMPLLKGKPLRFPGLKLLDLNFEGFVDMSQLDPVWEAATKKGVTLVGRCGGED